MYILGAYRDWTQNYLSVTTSCVERVHKPTDRDGAKRERVRRSYRRTSLPDKQDRLVEMDAECALMYLCLVAHADDLEVDRTYCLVTVDTLAQWTGLGHSKAESVKAKLRDT